jgi:hypothetical protein
LGKLDELRSVVGSSKESIEIESKSLISGIGYSSERDSIEANYSPEVIFLPVGQFDAFFHPSTDEREGITV